MVNRNKVAKVMLLNPPQKYFNNSLGFNVYFPLSLLYLAAAIRDICTVKIYDCLVEDFEIEENEEWTLYGSRDVKIREAVEAFNPDIVGITIPFSSQSNNAINVAKLCREVNPSITVVIGGPHATVRYKQLLLDGACDFCVIREGESTFKEFVERYNEQKELHNIKGVASIVDNKLTYKPREDLKDLDKLPMPAYDLINYRAYLDSPYLYKSRSSIGPGSISMITSRGCPFKCTFCSISAHMGRIYRSHSPDYVIKHIRYCIEEMGIKRFHFEDDNISLNGARFEEILDRIIESDFEISWDTPNGIRADTLDYSKLKKIKQSGNTSLQIAVESGNQRVLDEIIKKGSSLKTIVKIAEYCREIEISLRAFYIIGFPGERLADINDTINFALRMFKNFNVFPILLFATPLYGTELYDVCVSKGLVNETITDEEYAKAIQFYGEPLISTDDFSTDDLKKIGKEFEEAMNKMIEGRDYRNILKDKNTLFTEAC